MFAQLFPPPQPYPPMRFTRAPVLHIYWGGGLAGLAGGFALGFLLWLWQTGFLPVPELYATLKLHHARLQLLAFAGSFLLGFALQAGPNVVGGAPPPSALLLKFVPVLWLGLLLSLLPPAALPANLLLSLAFAGPAFLLLRVTLAGKPQLRLTRGAPLALAFVPLAAAPWLPLDEPRVALFILWCGPVTAALAAAQQLINNVLGGDLLQGTKARLFAICLALAWLLTGLAAFGADPFWRWAGLAWLAALALLTWGARFLPAVWKHGVAGISVTLTLAVAGLLAAAALMILQGEGLVVDAVVHLLGANVVTLLIIGVVSRVVGFFSGLGVFSDRVVVYLLLLWSPIALTRVASAFGAVVPTPWAAGMGALLLTVWGVRVAQRLPRIGRQFPPP